MPKLVLDFSNLIGGANPAGSYGATYAGWNGFFNAQTVIPIVPVGHVSGKVIKTFDEEGAETGTVHVSAVTADLPVGSAPELDPSLFYLTGQYGAAGTTGFVLRLDSGPTYPGSIVLPSSIVFGPGSAKVEIPPGSFNFVPQALAGTVIAYRNAFFAAIQTNLDKSFSKFDLYENAAVGPTIFGHFEASKPGETIPTFTGRQMLDGDASFDHFDFEVIGSSYADAITGNTGFNTFIGSLGSDSLTGKGKNDTFDYTDLRDGLDLPVGFDGFDPGSLVLIDGGAEDKTSAVNKGRDLLKLPGSAVDYNIKLDVAGLQLSNPVEWNKTIYDIVSPKSPEPPGTPVSPIVTMRIKDIEWVTFEEAVDNVVTPHLGNIATEALTLAAEVYGLRPTLGHAAEDLAYETFNSGGPLQSYNPNVASLARKRGWHALEAIELGIKPADYDPNPNTLKYSLHNGFYAAYKPSDLISIVSDTPEANALVLTGMLKGQRTLAISFRGTDQFADMAQFGNFSEYYDKFKPLIRSGR